MASPHSQTSDYDAFAPRPQRSELSHQSVRGGVINMGSQAIAVGLQIASTIVLARLLTPEDYGLMGMVMVVITFAALFKDLGLSSATIQKESLTAPQVSMMFWVNTCLGLSLTLTVAGCSPLVVWFYGKPVLLWMTVALAFNILLASLGAQHSALLTRQMRFRELAIARLSGAGIGLTISILAAWSGWAQWALVAGAIGGTTAQTSLFWFFSSWLPGFPKRNTGARAMINYGLNLTGFELVTFFSRNLDNILIGKVWGDGALGVYSRAYRLVLFPVSQIRTPLVNVAMPALARLQDDPLRFRNYYRRILSILALTCMPLSSFTAVCSEPLILTLLGPQWATVAPITSWLSIAAFLQPVAGLFGAVLMAKGLARRHFRCGIVSSLVLGGTFLFTVPHGVQALAIGYALAGYVLFVPIFLYASKGTGIHLSDFIGGVWRPALASVSSAVALLYLEQNLSELASWSQLTILAIVHAIITGGLILALPGSRSDLRDLYSYLDATFRPKIARHPDGVVEAQQVAPLN